MKFAGLPKFVLLFALVGVLTLALAGCGGTNNLVLTQGNWSVKAISTVNGNPTFFVGGNLTQTKVGVSATMHIVGSCFDPSQALTFTGTVKGKQVTLTSTPVNNGDSVVSVSATASDASTLSGTYTVSAGNNCTSSDQGTITANAVPSISGTWSGALTTSSGGNGVVLAMALTQASASSADGTFALTGTLAYTGSTCSVSGTVNNSYIAGSYVVISGATDDGSTIDYPFALLDSSTAPKNMGGGAVYSVTNGNCDGDSDTPTFTKQ